MEKDPFYLNCALECEKQLIEIDKQIGPLE